MDYHLPNVDNRGHLATYHLPPFVHVVIEQPPIDIYRPDLIKYTLNSKGQKILESNFCLTSLLSKIAMEISALVSIKMDQNKIKELYYLLYPIIIIT